MRRTGIAAALLVAGLGLAACQTLTEEMPGERTNNNPNGPNNAPTPVPVVVIPVPIPTPPPATPPPPPPQPQPQQPGPTPNPNNPPPNNQPPGDWPDNTNPVAKLTAKIYFIECFGRIVDPPAPVGCRVHLDVTPTDSGNRHTKAKGTPRWTYTNTSIISISGNSPYNPVLDAKAPGNLDCWAEVDGIRSNTVHVQIQ